MVSIALGIVKCLKRDIAEMISPDEIDFFEYFDNLKNIEFCEKKIDIRKVITYASSITKHEIKKAVE